MFSIKDNEIEANNLYHNLIFINLLHNNINCNPISQMTYRVGLTSAKLERVNENGKISQLRFHHIVNILFGKNSSTKFLNWFFFFWLFFFGVEGGRVRVARREQHNEMLVTINGYAKIFFVSWCSLLLKPYWFKYIL